MMVWLGFGVIFCLVISSSVPVLSLTPPGSPKITGPTFILEGKQVTLTCTSTGGDPTPTVIWYEGDTPIDTIQTGSGDVQTNDYTFIAKPKHQNIVFECQANNGVTQNPLKRTWYLQVYAEPDPPVLSGPTNMVSGTSYQHTCISRGGNPKPTLSLRIDSNSVTTGITESAQFITSDNSFTVTLVYSWTPTTNYNGATLYCQVDHPETRPNNPQITNLLLNVVDPLSVVAPQTQYTADVGSTIRLVCQVTGIATSLTWLRNDNQINVASENRLSNGVVSSPSLTITNIQSSDAGQYVCRATDGTKTVSTNTITLTVHSLPVVTIQSPTYTANYGNPVTLVCSVSAFPFQTNVYWLKDGSQTINSGDTGYSGSSTNTPSLTISSAKTTDKGQYRCFATNSVGTGSSSITTLDVQGGLLTVTIPQNTYSAILGSSVVIECRVTGQPTATSVTWLKNTGGPSTNINIGSSGGKYSGGTVSIPSLTIRNVAQSDEANYICSATNEAGTSLSQQAFLDVTGSIPNVYTSKAVYTILYGNPITIDCSVSANPQHTDVTWQKVSGGQTTNINVGNARYAGGTVSTPSLTISNAVTSDSGVYICTATNAVGTGRSFDATLRVSGDVPTVTVALPSYSTNIGATITLGCRVVSSPSENSVYWKRVSSGGQTTDIDINNSRYSGSTVSNPSLTIFNPTLNDEGNYVCYATNAIGTGNSQQTFLDVTGNIPTVTLAESSYTVDIGKTVTLECSVTATPLHTIVYWKKIVSGVATTISVSSQNRYSGSTVSTPSLTINRAESNDEGYYVCFATNEVGTGQSAQTYLDVTGSIPIVNIGSNSYTVNYGSSITIVCTVRSNPVHTVVSWTKIQNGVSTIISVSNSGKYQGSTVAQPSLTINNAGNSDEAFYVCSATNSVGKGQSSQSYLNVIGAIPVVQILSNYYNVEIGNPITLECQVTADPQHTTVQWRRIVNSVTTNIDITQTSKYGGGTVTNPSLIIKATTSNDEGYYVCTATNAVGTGTSSQAYVHVTGSILSVVVSQPTYTVDFGQSAQLVCSVSGNPPATDVHWEKIKNGMKTVISTANSNKYLGSTVVTPSLTILNADLSDQAVYTCFAENAIGQGQSQQTQLQVIGSVPSVTVGQGYSVNLGSSITIQCTVFATPSATSVSWNKIGSNGISSPINIVGNPNKYSGGSVNTPSLTIRNAADSDEAYYTCQATNAAGTGTSSQTYVDVLGSIPVVTIPEPQYSVTVGNTITLECTVEANPAHTSVTWSKIVNGQPTQVTTGSRITGSTVSNPSLTISNAGNNDNGYYVCSATNSVGTGQSAQTYLNVLGSLPVVTVLSTSYSVNIGNTVRLQCNVIANPPATMVMWQRFVNNAAVSVDMSNPRYSGGTVASPSLDIINAANTDEGFYICLAKNSVGTGQSRQTFLDVVGSIPTVTVPDPRYTVNRGASVTLQCKYTANPAAHTVKWEKIINSQSSDVDMTATGNKYGGSTTHSPSLIINNAEESDQGSYVCKVSNSIGTGISSATSLDVVGNIPVVTASPLAYTVNIGDSVTVICSVVADPQHTSVTWKKIVGRSSNIVLVTNSGGKYEGSTVSNPSLIINNAAFSDQGTYVCTATNSVGTGESTQVVVAVAGSVPSVTLSQSAYTANYGETVTIGCVISANPSHTSVYWQKVVPGGNPSTIDMSNTAKYAGSTVSQPDLVIKNIGTGDIAKYVCFAANSVGTGQSNQGPLNVIGSVPEVRISQTTYPINIGNTVTIDCSVVSNPAHTTVYWTRQTTNNQEETITTTGTASTKFGGSTVVSPSLIIYNAEESDQGTYICHATNTVGTGHSSQAFLDVVGNVPVVSATSVPSMRVGGTVTIQCTVVSNPAAIDVTWAKYINNQPTPIDIVNNKRLSGGIITNPSLTISPVEQDDEGNYVCQARNEVGTGSSNQVYVDITGDPPTKMSINPTKITIEEGETIRAKCLAQGSPDPTYTWFKDGSDNRFAAGSVLEITNAPRTALGTYTCRASNNYGSNELNVIVDVQYEPKVTISKTMSTYDGQGRQSINIPCSYMSNPAATSVFWTKFEPTPGTDTGNSEIIVVDGNKYQGGNLNSPSLTIYNLDKSDEGLYRCSASNIIGQGDSNYITLNVDTNAAPSYIMITPSQIVIEEGNGYTLTCEADGDPAPKYEWYHKDIKIHEGNVLTIENSVYTVNDGLHTCKATNKVGSRQATVDVDVKYSPISNVHQASFNPSLNNAVTLRCDTLANPSSTYWTWKYNGFDLDFHGKTYLVDMDSTADVGKYTCIAYNEVGQSPEIEFTVGLASPSTAAPTVVESVVSAGLTGGEIAAICLAALFGILLIVVIIVCCFVQGCCRKRRTEYVEREVIKKAPVPIPESYPVVTADPSVISVREVPRISYINPAFVDDGVRYLPSSTSRPYYLPVVEATYDDDERRHNKRKKKSRRYQEELPREDGIYLEERVAGSVRSRKGEEVITGPEMYFEAE